MWGGGGRDPGGFCGGRHTGADSWSHVTRLHSEPEANTRAYGERRDLCGEDGGGGCVPGEPGDVAPHQAGLERLAGGAS